MVRSGRARLYHSSIEPQHGIFISHTHGDKPLADAIQELMRELFGERVSVSYSSSKEEGGISPGKDWFRWIAEQVRDTSVAFVLLTPSSIQKPWVLWESGAVAGAAYAKDGSDDNARVIPLTYGLASSDVPTPFARMQVVSGTDEAEMSKLTTDLLERFMDAFSAREMAKFGERRPAEVKAYVAKVDEILLTLPHVVTEAAIQEWLGRLDALPAKSRHGDVLVMENWIDVAFGRDKDDRKRPLDVRIHRRLGDLYAKAGHPIDAERQYNLARRLVPRDIFILRRLGKSCLDQNKMDEARAILDQIFTLDKTAFERNIENAALKARVCTVSNNLEGARDVLAVAFDNTDSQYLGDLLGQTLVKLGQVDEAKKIYARVSRLLGPPRERDIWGWATALTSAVVCEDEAAKRAALERIVALDATRENRISIERGLEGVVKALGRGDEVLAELRGSA